MMSEKSISVDKVREEAHKKLLFALLRADDEEEVVEILKGYGYYDNEDVWEELGGYDNYGVIGNQAANPISSLNEIIVNSEDSMLLSECLKKDIDPTGAEAPKSMEEAVEKFFGIKNGDLALCDDKQRKDLSYYIGLVATGDYEYPCLGIFDKGMGQNPENFKDSFLSLPGTKKSASKSGVPFVQGLFNMGGSGNLLYCGKKGSDNNFKLILSKKNPDIKDANGLWGFTIIRKALPGKKHTMPTFVYLCPDGKIPSFKADSLPILPGKYPDAYSAPLEYGTYVKLYNYQLGSYSKLIQLELFYELNHQLFKPALPIRVYETREYKSHTHDTALYGSAIRLSDNEKKIMEKGFPQTQSIEIPNLGTIYVTIYALKKEARSGHYHRDHHVLFTVNGQMHYSKKEDFLTSEKVDKAYIAKDVLIVVDCTGLSENSKSKIFMPSRDRSRDSTFLDELLSELQVLLKNHDGLNDLNDKRKDEEMKEAQANQKPLKEILGKLVKKSNTFAKLFNPGVDISKPTDFDYKLDKKNPYVGEDPPNFFRTKDNRKEFQIAKGKRATITIQTDAQNDYFTRIKDRGKGPYLSPRSLIWNFTLWNGIMKLHIKPNKRAKEGDEIPIHITIKDPRKSEPDELDFKLEIVEDTPIVKDEDKKSSWNLFWSYWEPRANFDKFLDTMWNEFWSKIEEIKEPKNYNRKIEEKEGGEPTPSIKSPEIVPVKKDSQIWKDENFNENTGVLIKPYNDNYRFYVNISNKYYLDELANAKHGEHSIIQNQYIWGLVLQCLAIMHELRALGKDDNEIIPEVNIVSRGIAMSVVSVIRSLNKGLAKKS